MEHKKNIRFIFFISILLSLGAFVLDLKERVPDITENLRDISLMSFLFFIPLLILYGLYVIILKPSEFKK